MKTHDGYTVYVYDIEIFPNFFLASVFDGERVTCFREHQLHEFVNFVQSDIVLAGFNSFEYDDVVTKYICANPNSTTLDLFKLSSRIIGAGRNDPDIFKLTYSKTPWVRSIDVFQYVNKKNSLKEWQCRLQLGRVIESPCDFTKPLPASKWDEITKYCIHDSRSAWAMLMRKWELTLIRDRLVADYNLNHRAYVVGDAGLAQLVLMTRHRERTGQWTAAAREAAKENPDNHVSDWPATKIAAKAVRYKSPQFRTFLDSFLSSCHMIARDKQLKKWKLSNEWTMPLKLGRLEYQLGVGGIHSIDGPGVWEATKTHRILDLDVESYYPATMIALQLFPKHIGKSFIVDYAELRDRRIEAKANEKKAKEAGDKAGQTHWKLINAALKILVNSTFGKLNDLTSPMRSIPDAMRVTITGQLFLLMLVEMVELAGGEVLSVNTDGATVRWPRSRDIDAVMVEWSAIAGMKLELTEFKKYARRDVNAYVALKENGEVKAKGAYLPRPETDAGKWDGVIVKEAAQNYLAHGTDPAKTIRAGKGMDFLYYQKVKNGGWIFHGSDKIGRIARWYVAKKGKQIAAGKEGPERNVPNGANAVLALDAREILDFGQPPDLDLEWYTAKAWNLINKTRKDYEPVAGMDEDDKED